MLVDNEVGILSVLTTLLKAEEHEVVPISKSGEAANLIRSQRFDLMIIDIRMQPPDGMTLLKLAREEQPTVPVIMFTAYGTIESAIETIKLGAFHYLTKPFKVDELLITVQRALQYSRVLNDNASLRAQLSARAGFGSIISESRAMRNLCETIARVAATDTTLLITGESGTGKELVARSIHAQSNRANKRFVAVNCAALPEALLESEMFGHVKGAFTGAATAKKGLFEAANDGTIFLDEIGSMPLSLQGKLLRVLQEREIRNVGGTETVAVNARVLAATNTRLENLIEEQRFRTDLFYRLNVIPIEISPLRERREDILPLVWHFVKRETAPDDQLPVLTPEARDILERYDWPGNAREIENAVKHAMTFANDRRITPEVLPPRIISAVNIFPPLSARTVPGSNGELQPLKNFLQEQERVYLTHALRRFNGDKNRTAAALKISLPTLYRKLPHDPLLNTSVNGGNNTAVISE